MQSKKVSAFGQNICKAFLKRDLFKYEGLVASSQKMVERQRRMDGIQAKLISKGNRREFDIECEKRYKEIENFYPSQLNEIGERFNVVSDSINMLPNKLRVNKKLEITYGYSEKYITEKISSENYPPTYDIFIPIINNSGESYILVLSDVEFTTDDIIFFGVPRFENK